VVAIHISFTLFGLIRSSNPLSTLIIANTLTITPAMRFFPLNFNAFDNSDIVVLFIREIQDDKDIGKIS
jgi:hypothetical protein